MQITIIDSDRYELIKGKILSLNLNFSDNPSIEVVVFQKDLVIEKYPFSHSDK